MRLAGVAILMVLLSGNAFADDVIVEKADVEYQGDDKFDFSITLRHNDSGWDHYANKCEVLDADGKVLGTLTFVHPHEDEQPFTRTLSGVSVPKGLKRVTLRAHDNKHGESKLVLSIDLPDRIRKSWWSRWW